MQNKKIKKIGHMTCKLIAALADRNLYTQTVQLIDQDPGGVLDCQNGIVIC